MCSTADNLILILDAFEGQVLGKCVSHENEKSLTLQATFTKDSKYIISGSGDGKIHVWNAKTFKEVVQKLTTFETSQQVTDF